MFYTSNERDVFSLPNDISESEKKLKLKKVFTKKYFFNFYFSIVHISINNVLGNLVFCMHVDNIHPEGTVKKRVTI